VIDLNFEPRHFFALAVSILVTGLLNLGFVASFFAGAGLMLWVDLLFHIGIYIGKRWNHRRTTPATPNYPDPPSPSELPDEFETREIAVYDGRVYGEAEDGGVEVVHEVESEAGGDDDDSETEEDGSQSLAWWMQLLPVPLAAVLHQLGYGKVEDDTGPVEEIREAYAEGEIGDRELEGRLDEVMGLADDSIEREVVFDTGD